MSLAGPWRSHQEQSRLIASGVLADKPLCDELRLLKSGGILHGIALAIGQFRLKALEVALFVVLRNPRALHDAPRPLPHPAVARHGYLACRAVCPRHELPSRPSAQRAIFERHYGDPQKTVISEPASTWRAPQSNASSADASIRSHHLFGSCLLWESCGSLLLSGRNTRYDQELSREGRKTDRSGTCLPHRLRSRPHNRMPRGPLSRVARRHARQLLLYDLCELAHLFFHLDHLLAHIQNNFDSCQVHAHVARQRQDHFQPFQIRIRVEPRISLRARRLQQPHALVQAQGLRMQLVELRDGADHVSCLGPFFRCCWHDVSAQTWFFMSIGTLRASRERKGFRSRSPRSRPNGSREIPCEVLRLRRLKTSKPICSLHHGDSWIPVFSQIGRAHV